MGASKEQRQTFYCSKNISKDSTYSFNIIKYGSLLIPVAFYENGTYTMKGDSIMFNVTAYGINDNALALQSKSLKREGSISGKRITLLDEKGEPYEVF
ncbi:hypothetical protein [Pontibacter actiniarum]|uniref:Uncharacterized protein n=1 Tax=Pontibacter actiniarum TaxID=323450 RepID=A0A1X9YMK7_9BACT|nr:hypothetical protein [Pontibacter actiniarum]ARS34110.1 hypothetical protein CA264_00890 [Pontibacter actiniarum]